MPGSDLGLLQVKLVTYEIEDLFWGPVLIFPCLPSNLVPDTELLEFVYVGDRLALSNQSSSYWWILIPLCKAICLISLATTVNCMGAVDRPNGSALNW